MNRGISIFVMTVLSAALPAAAQIPASARSGPVRAQAGPVGRLTQTNGGAFPTREGLRLRLVTDVGSVRIHTAPGSREVTYTARIETDSAQPDAVRLLKQFQLHAAPTPEGVQVTGSVPWSQFRGRLWVTLDVTVPRNYSLDVVTHAGNVTAEDVDGRVALASKGGNITAGRVGGGARLETEGGHITVQDVGGELVALTAGGHITTGHVAGGAVLRTAGGHIKVMSIQGAGQLETGGGDVHVEKTGAKLVAISDGGQITFAEAAGSIDARTSGGGVRVLRVTGPMQLQTAAGSIFLTQVRDSVRASTNSGSITAWFTPDWKKADSKLTAGQGDIVVYLPRELALTIDAVIEMGAGHQVIPDPALPIKVSLKPSAGTPKALRAEGVMNGGGDVLTLHTVAGNIYLRPADAARQQVVVLRRVDQAQRAKEVVQQLEQQAEQAVAAQRAYEKHLQQELENAAQEADRARREHELVVAREKEKARQAGRFEEWVAKFSERFSRPFYVGPEEQRKKLVHEVRPNYPDFARRNGVSGLVRLQVLIGEDGEVENVEVVSGHRSLAYAAQSAVNQWRYRPTMVKGKAVKVTTRIDVEFRLN